jgi:hypothetical protein
MTGELLYLESNTSIGFERLSVLDGQTVCSIDDEILMPGEMTVHTAQYLSKNTNKLIVFGNDSNQTLAQIYYANVSLWSSQLPLGGYFVNISATILPGFYENFIWEIVQIQKNLKAVNSISIQESLMSVTMIISSHDGIRNSSFSQIRKTFVRTVLF